MKKNIESIGGFLQFELLPFDKAKNIDLQFNTARSSLAFLLLKNDIKKIQIPRYTCEVVLQPLKIHNIEFSFYDLDNDLLPLFNTQLIDSEIPLLVNNYFGILDAKIETLDKSYKTIIDNSQALYSTVIGTLGSFNSYRKFLGLPDGSKVNTSNTRKTEAYSNKFPRQSVYKQLEHLFGRFELGPERVYETFKTNESKLDFKEIKQISKISEFLFNEINHDQIIHKRLQNFMTLNKHLKNNNILEISEKGLRCPMVYPYLTKQGEKLRKFLIDNHIYIAKYWPNTEIILDENSFEFNLHQNLVALPIDQRYSEIEMNQIIDLINRFES
ncbi:MAG: hypothetical protein KKH44_07275 [Bacteroidetes bacterium]|nr:hypothetical protein [Bacteroidota bacterium]